MTRTLYTLCGANPAQRFSPHSWKVVMALAHKGLDFVERPTPFTEIRSLEDGFSTTVPVLNDGSQLVRDSFDIALYLEDTYPDRPTLFAGEGGKALSRMVEGYVQTILQAALMRIIVKDIHDCLAPADQAYFRTTREQRLGRTLEDVDANHAGELAAFQPRLEPVRHMLKFQPFLGGDGPLFADYILFGALQWARVVSPKRLLAADDPVRDWFERCLDLHGKKGRQVLAA
jgi:glutathione S-transferase